jgi:cyclase
MKFRLIPVILTDGVTVVKGTQFNNWRTVGNVQAVARLFAARDVDELMFLDVNARQKNNKIDIDLMSYFAETLQVPFSVGGGINTLSDARDCMRNGAEKIVLGTAALENPDLINQISNEFGSQAVTVALDVYDHSNGFLATYSGKNKTSENAVEVAQRVQDLGAGEILLQSVERDGTLSGLDKELIERISANLTIPLIVSGGTRDASDILDAISAGADAIGIGALFQFTQHTPMSISQALQRAGIPVRVR